MFHALLTPILAGHTPELKLRGFIGEPLAFLRFVIVTSFSARCRGGLGAFFARGAFLAIPVKIARFAEHNLRRAENHDIRPSRLV